MRKARRNFFATAYQGKLYAVGGCEDQSMEVYDPEMDSWSDAKISTREVYNYIRGCIFSHKYVHQK